MGFKFCSSIVPFVGHFLPLKTQQLIYLIQKTLVGTLNVNKGLEDIMKMERVRYVMENVEKRVFHDMFFHLCMRDLRNVNYKMEDFPG